MRNHVYRLFFILVAVSVIADVTFRLMLWAGLKQSLSFMLRGGGLLMSFSHPIPTVIAVYDPLNFLATKPVQLGFTALMFLLVARRIAIFARIRVFAASSDNFFLGPYVLVSTGLGSLALAILIFCLSLLGGGNMSAGSFAMLGVALASFLLPLAFFVNELWSLRQR
jgi:hypothetical protein